MKSHQQSASQSPNQALHQFSCPMQPPECKSSGRTSWHGQPILLPFRHRTRDVFGFFFHDGKVKVFSVPKHGIQLFTGFRVFWGRDDHFVTTLMYSLVAEFPITFDRTCRSDRSAGTSYPVRIAACSPEFRTRRLQASQPRLHLAI